MISRKWFPQQQQQKIQEPHIRNDWRIEWLLKISIEIKIKVNLFKISRLNYNILTRKETKSKSFFLFLTSLHNCKRKSKNTLPFCIQINVGLNFYQIWKKIDNDIDINKLKIHKPFKQWNGKENTPNTTNIITHGQIMVIDQTTTGHMK